ncbi:transposase [Candidatus Uabimicrobium sp. HlEnr_7]|uniref:transposase n=1 Tax=Candidatus Uabimicrobium helgolandensis TaxID=3095367 RepID=UPI0035565569
MSNITICLPIMLYISNLLLKKISTPGCNQVLCMFGFFNPHTREFFHKFVNGRKQKMAKNFIASLHQIRAQFKKKKIHIVVDNASIHSKKN